MSTIIPPIVIFDAKNLNHHWTADEIPGTKYGLSDKGWITSELFEGWLVEHFLEHAVSRRPLLLLLDGHSTHYQPEIIRLARNNDVIMLYLPSHTTHETQPLDCGVFGPLKTHWTAVCHNYFQKKPGKVITKFNFNFLFSKDWLQTLTPANLIAGFKTCGIFPLNPSAITINSSSNTHSDPPTDTASREEKNECHNDVSDVSESFSIEETGSVFLYDGHPVMEDPVCNTEFNSQQEALFRRRFEVGYNLNTDPKYNCWLEINHPELEQHSDHSSNQETIQSVIDPSQPVAEITN